MGEAMRDNGYVELYRKYRPRRFAELKALRPMLKSQDFR